MKSLFGNVRTTIQITVIIAFVTATALTASLAIGLQYYFGQSMAKTVAADLYSTASSAIASELRSVVRVNANVIDLLAENPVLTDPENENAHLAIFTQVLLKNPLYYGIYLGGDDGSFFEVINLETSETARNKLRAHPRDRWLIITLNKSANGLERQYRYLDENLKLRLTRSEPTDYDVHSRPWYASAIATNTVQLTEPYIFAQLGLPGRTLSKRLQNSDTVVAIDMTLATMSEFLAKHNISEHGDVYLYNSSGEVIASSVDQGRAPRQVPVPSLVLTEQEKQFVAAQPTLNVSNELNWPPFDYTQAGEPYGYSIDVIRMIAGMTGLKVNFINGFSWPELITLYQRGDIDLLHSVISSTDNSRLGLAGASYTDLPYTLVTRDDFGSLTSLSELSGQTVAIPTGWSTIPILRTRFPKIDIIETNTTLDALKLVKSGEATAALDSEAIMRFLTRTYFLTGLKFHPESYSVARELPHTLHILVPADRLELRQLLDKAIAAIDDEHRRYLATKWLTPNEDAGTDYSNLVPSDALIQMATNPEMQGQLREVPLTGETYLAYVARADEGENPIYIGILTPRDALVSPFLDQVKLSIATTAVFLLLMLPLSWIFARPIVQPIRQLALENDKVQRREFAKVKHVVSNVKELNELSDSMVNMVNAIKSHEQEQRALMDAFIEIIAQAIDDKSAYTGGHCKRVPELALMLAEHAAASDQTAFRNFDLVSDDQWREFRISAWLHDCGKITTPEHIVDKGSKLEVIYNRLHEIRMRFEVLWRDAEINYLRQCKNTPAQAEQFAQERTQRQQGLLEQFAFVASCNVGGEFLDDDKRLRLQEIAKQTWQRHFDNRIGLSPLEELRIQGPAPTLPATELLLNDKPEHIIEREHAAVYPPEYGIDMDIPEHLYNQGELYNLSISRGTLTKEDRFKINEHMISTIKMLESLPFPEELKNVPRYASTHHETLRGTGYPRKLPGEALSIPERILAIADIFEALTASDRPYKKAKTISEAISIMHRMVLNNHIDRDCFELFLRDKVYLQYAKEFLPAEQIDEFDADKYLTI